MLCKHPVEINDPLYPGHKKLVPCGSCSVCLQERVEDWKRRLDVEQSQHKYTYFVTLTYNDYHVPVFRPDDISTYYGLTSLQEQEVYEYLSTHDFSEQYLVLRYEDIQLFLKKLRNYVSRTPNLPEEESFIRFFVCCEYGETSYRPHYHILIYSDSDILCKNTIKFSFLNERKDIEERTGTLFEYYCYKAWTTSDYNSQVLKGDVKCEPVDGDASGYVSKYCLSTACLPEFLRCSPFRPFIMASRCPSIGSFKMDDAQAKEIIDKGFDAIHNEFGTEDKGNVDLPLYRSIKDRLFPKCERFFDLSHVDRSLLYGLYKVAKCGSFNDLIDNLREDHIRQLKYIFRLDPVDYPEEFSKKLRRHYRMSKWFCNMCARLNVTPAWYMRKIEEFYLNRQYDKLLKQFNDEEEISWAFGTPFALTYVDPLVFRNVSDDSLTYILESFGLDDDVVPESIQYVDLPEVQEKVRNIDHFINVGKTYKKKSDALLSKNCLTNKFVV